MTDQAYEEVERLAVDGGLETPHAVWVRDGDSTEFRRELHEHTSRLDAPCDREDDPDFRVAIPLSGGLDSSTCYEMAKTAGMPVSAFYIDTGAPYSEAERAHLAGRGVDASTISLDVKYRHDGIVDIGRNAIIIMEVASELATNGQWGELWFGVHSGAGGESPIRGGDKSHRFLLTINQLLRELGYDMRVAAPLAGMTKTDMVRWWLGRDRIEEALRTFSCFTPYDGDRCGTCKACFRWWAAFASAGLPIHRWRYVWPHPPRWPKEIVDALRAPPTRMEFAAGRVEPLLAAVDSFGAEVLA